MSQACPAIRRQAIRRTPPRVAADWLSLAAAPTFAIMALLTACSAAARRTRCVRPRSASPLGGMVPMYLLMSAFHSAPWLKLIAGRA